MCMLDYFEHLEPVSVTRMYNPTGQKHGCWHNSIGYERANPQHYRQVSGWIQMTDPDCDDAWLPHYWVEDLRDGSYFDTTPVVGELRYYLDPSIRLLGNRAVYTRMPHPVIQFKGNNYYRACTDYSYTRDHSVPLASATRVEDIWRHSVRSIDFLDLLEDFQQKEPSFTQSPRTAESNAAE